MASPPASRAESVTHVSGTFCYPCLGTVIKDLRPRKRPLSLLGPRIGPRIDAGSAFFLARPRRTSLPQPVPHGRVRLAHGTGLRPSFLSVLRTRSAGAQSFRGKRMTTLRINRAPVLTLWAAVVAERLGSPWEPALTVGQAVAGMTAHAKGVRLGIYAQPEERPHEPAPPKPEGATGAVRSLPLLGHNVPGRSHQGRPAPWVYGLLANIVRSCGKVARAARSPGTDSTEVHPKPGSAAYPLPGTFLSSSPASIALTPPDLCEPVPERSLTPGTSRLPDLA